MAFSISHQEMVNQLAYKFLSVVSMFICSLLTYSSPFASFDLLVLVSEHSWQLNIDALHYIHAHKSTILTITVESIPCVSKNTSTVIGSHIVYTGGIIMTFWSSFSTFINICRYQERHWSSHIHQCRIATSFHIFPLCNTSNCTAAIVLVRVQHISIITVALIATNSVVASLRAVISVLTTLINVWKRWKSTALDDTCTNDIRDTSAEGSWHWFGHGKKEFTYWLPKHFAVAKPASLSQAARPRRLCVQSSNSERSSSVQWRELRNKGLEMESLWVAESLVAPVYWTLLVGKYVCLYKFDYYDRHLDTSISCFDGKHGCVHVPLGIWEYAGYDQGKLPFFFTYAYAVFLSNYVYTL